MRLQKRQLSKPLHEQITAVLRKEILTQCQPGEKLDSERKLAAQLGISTLTLSKVLNVLAHDGLLERRRGQGRGTYVADTSAQRHVAIWTGFGWEVPDAYFFHSVVRHLFSILEQQGYRHRLYICLGEQSRPLADEFEAGLSRGKVVGAAIVSAGPVEALAQHHIPCVTTGGSYPQGVGVDYVQLVRDGARYLLERGCRRIALMGAFDVTGARPAADRVQAAFQTALRERGVAVEDKWIRLAVTPLTAGSGWEQFREILSARAEKPDGLLVTDDVLFRDVALGILDSHIRVPDQLQVIAHANKGAEAAYPFPLARLLIDPQEYAQAMVEILIQLMNHQPVECPQRLIQAQLIPPAGTVPTRSFQREKEEVSHAHHHPTQ